ncbi:MAG: YtxH domain-containing protein [bacterium]|nr:YtxH domain-containing protein [bacterium]
MFKEKNSSNAFILGLLTGGLVGAAAALLYAPKTGKELRKDINYKKDELLNEASNVVDNAKKRASGIITEAKERAMYIVEEGKKKVSSAADTASGFISEEKEMLMDEASKLSKVFKSETENNKADNNYNKKKHS